MIKMPQQIKDKFATVILGLRDAINIDARCIEFSTIIEDGHGILASIQHTPNRRWSTMRLYSEYFELDNSQCLSTILHELIHTYWHEADEELDALLEDILSPIHKRIVERIMTKRQEYMVDDLSVALERLVSESDRARYYEIFDLMRDWYDKHVEALEDFSVIDVEESEEDSDSDEDTAEADDGLGDAESELLEDSHKPVDSSDEMLDNEDKKVIEGDSNE